MSTCKTSPPPGQDINEYLIRLKDIVKQLNEKKDKEITIERLDLMITAIKSSIQTTNPEILF
jgi:hypothetical protein